jgi:hypothetical protein
VLHRKCAFAGSANHENACEDCQGKQLQRRVSGDAASPATAPPIVHDVLGSPGRPLDACARSFFEPRFARDFSRVRVHTDERAAESARAVNAAAYTAGRNSVFRGKLRRAKVRTSAKREHWSIILALSGISLLFPGTVIWNGIARKIQAERYQ